MEKERVSILGLLYLILITGVVLWLGITWTNYMKKEKVSVTSFEHIQSENKILTEENILLKKENKELKEQLDMHNSINFSILSSLVEEYSKLKDENKTLQDENIKAKKDLDKATSTEKHIIMKIE